MHNLSIPIALLAVTNYAIQYGTNNINIMLQTIVLLCHVHNMSQAAVCQVHTESIPAGVATYNKGKE